MSRGVESELREHYRIGSAPVKIVPNAADLSIFKPLPEEQRLAWRSGNGLGAEDIVFIFAGGEWVRKGLDLAIRALSLVPDRRAKLYIAGDDAARETLNALAAECGVADRVIFGGFRKDVPIALASSDVFLFPSWYEAFSLATIEAAACGLPIVATSINGTEDFIQPGITGEFVKSDPKHIAQVIDPLIQNAQQRRTMGENARRLVEQKYTWDRVTDATENAYKEYLKLGKFQGDLTMHLLVVSHSCATPINQQIYAELERQTGWKITLVVPEAWKDEFGNTLNKEKWPEFSGDLISIPVWNNGNIILHIYKENWGAFLEAGRFSAIYVNHEPYALATAHLCWANSRTLKAPFGFYSCQNILKKYPPPFSWIEGTVFRKSAFAFPITEAVKEVLVAKGYRGIPTVCALPLDPAIYQPRGSEEDLKLIPRGDREIDHRICGTPC